MPRFASTHERIKLKEGKEKKSNRVTYHKYREHNDNLYTNLHLDIITNKELLKKKKKRKSDIYDEINQLQYFCL